MSPLRVLHLITGLHTGGAEMMLYKLLCASDRERIAPSVATLIPGGDLRGPIAGLGVPVHDLGLRRGGLDPRGVPRLIALARRLEVDLLQTWMYHANLLGALAWPGLGRIPLVWNLRQGDQDPRAAKASTRLVTRLCAPLSWLAPRRIVCCSERARTAHAALGYRRPLMQVIPNGFDLTRFRPDPAARLALRAELALPQTSPLVGLAGRFHPQKDVAGFIAAAARVLEPLPECRFLLCGEGMGPENPLLAGWLDDRGVAHAFSPLGLRHDMPRVLAGLDVLALASIAEGFPNVIGEAMACGTPCAVTDVGDSALIVGDTGRVVPPGDPQALAAAILSLLHLDPGQRANLGTAARERIAERYGIAAIAAIYDGLHLSLARAPRP